MSNLTLKNIFPSDAFSVVIQKFNENMDNILRYGGGRIGDTGRQGDRGFPGPTGDTGADGDTGNRGASILYSPIILVDDNPITTVGSTTVYLGDWIIDSSGNYFTAIESLTGGLKLQLEFNVIDVSAITYVRTQHDYIDSSSTPIARWTILGDNAPGDNSNLVFVKRTSGTPYSGAYDSSNFYRVMVGMDVYPISTNTSLVIANIIPDANDITPTEANDNPFKQISLRYRPNAASPITINSGDFCYYEDGTKGFFNLDNNDVGISLINTIAAVGETTIGIRSKNFVFVGSADDYFSATNFIKFAIINGSFPSLTISTSLTKWTTGDGLSIGTDSGIELNLPIVISSRYAIYAITLTPTPSTTVLDLEDPNGDGSGDGNLSRFYTYNSDGNHNIIDTINGGVPDQIITIKVDDDYGLLIKNSPSLILKDMTDDGTSFIRNGDFITLYAHALGSGFLIWKELSRSSSEFSVLYQNPTDFDAFVIPGAHTIDCGFSSGIPLNANPSDAYGVEDKILHINFVDTKPADGTGSLDASVTQQWQLLSGASSDVKLNPIYTRRLNTIGSPYKSDWNKLISEYGGNDIHDYLNIFGALKLKPTNIRMLNDGVDSYVVNEDGISHNLFATGNRYSIPSSILRGDDQSSSLYNIQVDDIYYALPNFGVTLPIVNDSVDEIGRMIVLNLGITETGSAAIIGAGHVFKYHIFSGDTQLLGIAPNGDDYYTCFDYTKSAQLVFMAVPVNNEASHTPGTPYYKWALLSSNESTNVKKITSEDWVDTPLSFAFSSSPQFTGTFSYRKTFRNTLQVKGTLTATSTNDSSDYAFIDNGGSTTTLIILSSGYIPSATTPITNDLYLPISEGLVDSGSNKHYLPSTRMIIQNDGQVIVYFYRTSGGSDNSYIITFNDEIPLD